MNVKFSRIIQGCMTWGKWGKNLAKNEMISLMHHCMEHGISSFDHADIYGDYTTEIEFGEAFKDSGILRDSVEIISKCGIQYVGDTRSNEIKHYQYDANYIIWSAEKSISDLNADYLDLLLLHRPSPLMHPDEISKAADLLLSQGKIKSFGVSNFTPSQMNLVSSTSEISANQIEFSLTQHKAMHDGTLDHMKLNGIMPMCWSPLGSVFREESAQSERIHEVLNSLCERYSATKDQLLLAWILKHPSGIHPVIGTTSPERIANAARVPDIDLSEIDWFKMLVAAQGHKVP